MATSTWKRLSKSQAFRGLLMVAMVRGTSWRVRATKHRARLSASPRMQAASTCARAAPARSSTSGSVALPSKTTSVGSSRWMWARMSGRCSMSRTS